MRLVKVDKRYAYSQYYSHRLEFGSYGRTRFYRYWQIIKYLTESYGAGMPLDAIIPCVNADDPVTIWAHGTMSNGDPVVYVKDSCLTEIMLIPERFEELVKQQD